MLSRTDASIIENESEPIGILVTSWFPLPVTSGGRKRCVRLLETMQSAGLQPHVMTPYAEPASIAAAEARGWHVHIFPSPRSLSDRIARRFGGDLAPPVTAGVDELRELARNAAFVQLEEIGGMRWATSTPERVPLVASAYNVDSLARTPPRGRGIWSKQAVATRFRQHRMASIEERAVRRAIATVCVTPQDAAHFEAQGAQRTVIAPNGVDDELLSIQAPSWRAQRVLFFGQLEYRPNAEGLVRFIESGWAAVREACPEAELHVVGHGASSQVHVAARKAPGVRVVGFVEDLTTELEASRAVVAPIRFGGGTRLKVLEALAAGRPVVGTALAVERIGFEHGRHGFVADTDESMGRALAQLLTDAELAATQGDAGRDLARSYLWMNALAPVRDLYDQLLRTAVARSSR
jgi:glycosyltransferase involved in cell wall biosynthesis